MLMYITSVVGGPFQKFVTFVYDDVRVQWKCSE